MSNKRSPSFTPRAKKQLKGYPLNQSPLYKLTTKKKLLEVLGISQSEVKKLSLDSSYRVFKNETGREIQEPLNRLKATHRRIGILLGRIELPSYLHSGRKGCSIVTNANIHKNGSQLLKLDINKFFPSTNSPKIYRFLCSVFQMQPDVAYILTNLVSYNGHVPTGSPISMSLAFWANKTMFDALDVLSSENGLEFTVYVDDVAFSGDVIPKGFSALAKACIAKHGMLSKPKKEKYYSERQAKLLTGVVISQGELRVRWKHSKSIISDMVELAGKTSGPHKVEKLEQIAGRLHAAGQIDFRIKDRAKYFTSVLRMEKKKLA